MSPPPHQLPRKVSVARMPPRGTESRAWLHVSLSYQHVYTRPGPLVLNIPPRVPARGNAGV